MLRFILDASLFIFQDQEKGYRKESYCKCEIQQKISPAVHSILAIFTHLTLALVTMIGFFICKKLNSRFFFKKIAINRISLS